VTDLEKAGLILALEMDADFRSRVRELLRETPGARAYSIGEEGVEDAAEAAGRRRARATERAAVEARPEPPSEYRPSSNPQRAVRALDRGD
jgi:hypothetical protein